MVSSSRSLIFIKLCLIFAILLVVSISGIDARSLTHGRRRSTQNTLSSSSKDWREEKRMSERREIEKAEKYLKEQEKKQRKIAEQSRTEALRFKRSSVDPSAVVEEEEDNEIEQQEHESSQCTHHKTNSGKIACELTRYFSGELDTSSSAEKRAKELADMMRKAVNDEGEDDLAVSVLKALKAMEVVTTEDLKEPGAKAEKDQLKVSELLKEVRDLLVESKTMETAKNSAEQLHKSKSIFDDNKMEPVVTGALDSARKAHDLRARLSAIDMAKTWVEGGTNTIGSPTLPEIQADIKASLQAYDTAKVRLGMLMDRAHVASKALGDAVQNVTDLSGALNTHVDLLRDSAKAVRAARAYVHYVALLHDHVKKKCELGLKMGQKQQGEDFNIETCVPFVEGTELPVDYVPDDGSKSEEVKDAYKSALSMNHEADGDVIAAQSTVDPEFPKETLEEVAPSKEAHDRAIEEVEKLDLEDDDEEEEAEGEEESELVRLRAQVKELLAEKEVEEESEEGEAEEESEEGEAESEEEEAEEAEAESEEEDEADEPEKPTKKPTKKKKKTWHKPTIVPSLPKKTCECEKKESMDPCDCAEEKKEEEDVGGAPTQPLFLDPCPACGDGIQNCGETGIDCGGPCAKCAPPPIKKLPKGASVIDALWVGETKADREQELAQLGKKYKPSSGHATIQYRRTDLDGHDATVNVTYGLGGNKEKKNK